MPLSPAPSTTNCPNAMIQRAGLVNTIQKFSLHDGMGIRTTVFLQGCPLRCRWCANPETQCAAVDLTAPVNLQASRMTVAEVAARVKKDWIFLTESGGGITYSGGEATAQPDFLRALVHYFASFGIHQAIETCGYFERAPLTAVFQCIDQVFYDIKLWSSAMHRQYCAVDNEVIKQNLQWLSTLGTDIVVRIPLIPTVNDDEATARAIARFVKATLDKPCIEVLPFHPYGMGKYQQLGYSTKRIQFAVPSQEAVRNYESYIIEEGVTIANYK